LSGGRSDIKQKMPGEKETDTLRKKPVRGSHVSSYIRERIMVTITLDEYQAHIVKNATEFYSRVLWGQFGEINNAVNSAQLEKVFHEQGEQAMHEQFDELIERRDRSEDILKDARQVLFPELHALGHYGLGYSERTDVAFNVYQAIRYAFAWKNHPEGGITVDFNKPHPVDGHDTPKVEIVDGK